LTLRQDRAAEPDWGMYQGPSRDEASGHRPPTPALLHEGAESQPVHPAPATAEAARPAEVAHEGEVPAPPRAPAATATSRPEAPKAAPVNPWEARWRAAGARLPSTAPRPPKVERPEPSRATGRYPGVSLKGPSTGRPRPVDPPVSPPPSRGF